MTAMEIQVHFKVENRCTLNRKLTMLAKHGFIEYKYRCNTRIICGVTKRGSNFRQDRSEDGRRRCDNNASNSGEDGLSSTLDEHHSDRANKRSKAKRNRRDGKDAEGFIWGELWH